MPVPCSLYIHAPFCAHRCAYCDFNTYAGQDEAIPAYVTALCGELDYLGEIAPDDLSFNTVFFGGGTPSLLTPHQLQTILKAVDDHFDLSNEAEISLEANPGTLSPTELCDLASIGVNRLSLGVQSAHPVELRMLERSHTYFEVIRAVKWARKAGFDNISLDLIYGLPLQTLDDWAATVKLALGLHPEHLSLYALTIEPGTPFGRWASRGLIPIPDPDTAADMYDWVDRFLVEAGFQQYEISNWSKPGRECRHNLQYWRGLPYLAAGAGAHGYAGGFRYSNALRIKTYIDRLRKPPQANLHFPLTPAAVQMHRQTLQDDMSEYMLTGLRLTREGVSPTTFHERFGQEMEVIFGAEIRELIDLGLLARSGDRLRLTPRGRLISNQVFLRFIQ